MSVYRVHLETLERVKELIVAIKEYLARTTTKNEIERGATYVVIFRDRGERYLDTIYSDKWVEEQFGDVAHLWQSSAEVPECITVTAI